MEEVIRVNMTHLKIDESPLPEAYKHMGGRAITSSYVKAEVSPLCEPLGRHNKLVIAPGLLTGTGLSSSGRLSIGCKSVMTGGIKESNAGGVAATKMANLGIKVLIIEGFPLGEDLYVLYINKGGATLIKANDCRGMGNYALAEKLKDRFGKRIGIISNGPAGEMLLAAAGITNTDGDGVPSRFCARGGVGAVMGSKKLKAIVLDDADSREVTISDRKSFAEISRQLNKMLRDSPGMQGFAKFGTAATLYATSEAGALPTKNFRMGQFTGSKKIDAQALHDTIIERGGSGKTTHSCMPGCIIRCSNVYPDQSGNTIVSPLEYETIGLLGSNCCIDDLDTIAWLNYYCNDLGLDTIDVGATLGLAMEIGLLDFGDGEKAIELLKEIGQETVLGHLMGSGAELFGRVMGINRIPTNKGQAMAAYDPRGIKGNGVTYATSPMGADHTAGNTIRGKEHHSPANKVEASLNSQIISAAFDSLGLCIFVGSVFIPNIQLIVELICAKEGKAYSPDFIPALGKSIIDQELRFNEMAGVKSFHMPEFMVHEPLPPFNVTFDVPQQEMDDIFKDVLKSN